ncbi:hypothetical protein DOM22_11705 [Bdellovibrio sp. ZAP7]|uniref:hypothetical protein n=1 Tax=Bdellovibrio sp. ZAP7 TaxID=2231053 RepID=UPI00115B33BD|nr:hypothetical protein [Bdellovibrio sp. ZAP7]QDK45764.1 hypothetical protein DOM22_11705 [Bdellovibrio sp. ZAP7]
MKSLLSLVLVILSFATSAYAADEWKRTAIPVRPSSKIQKQIDLAVSQVFAGKIHNTFCQVFQNKESLQKSLGVTPATAESLRRSCPRSTETTALSTKLNSKIYLLSFNGPRDLDSWTDSNNRTYIFINGRLSQRKLESILLHEISIALDAKYNFTMKEYLSELQRRGYSPAGNQNDLENAFIGSMWRPVALTFATLRAFNIEAINNGRPSLTLSQSSCASHFRQAYQVIQRIPYTPPALTTEAMLYNASELLIARQSEAVAPQSAAEAQRLISLLSSSSIQVRDFKGRQISFCEFMAAPALTSNALGSFLSNGPRPRLTGGSGGESGFTSQDDGKVQEALDEARKEQSKYAADYSKVLQADSILSGVSGGNINDRN